MPLSDEDLELLDRYLDGDLREAEAVGLEARLAADASLAAAVKELRDARQARLAAFSSMEPSELEAQQLQWRLAGALRQVSPVTVGSAIAGDWRHRARRAANGLSRIAAVLLVGFVVGYAFRSQPAAVPSPGSGAVAGIPVPQNFAGAGGDDTIRPVTAYTGPQENAGGYDVALRDQFGNVIAVKRFRTIQEARDFAGDLERWQQRYRQVQKNGVRFVGDDF